MRREDIERKYTVLAWNHGGDGLSLSDAHFYTTIFFNCSVGTEFEIIQYESVSSGKWKLRFVWVGASIKVAFGDISLLEWELRRAPDIDASMSMGLVKFWCRFRERPEDIPSAVSKQSPGPRRNQDVAQRALARMFVDVAKKFERKLNGFAAHCGRSRLLLLMQVCYEDSSCLTYQLQSVCQVRCAWITNQ